MFCNKCGAQLSDDSVFCIKCGNNVSDAATAPAQVQVAAPVQVAVPDVQPVPVQPVKNATGGWGFAIPALISGVLSVFYSVYWAFFRQDFIKNTIDPMWISPAKEAEARALLNLVDNLAGFPFGGLALLFAILALLKGSKGARIIAIIALLIGTVGVWLFRVISYLCLYLAA